MENGLINYSSVLFDFRFNSDRRILILNLDPLEIYYVGAGGKRKSIRIDSIRSVSRGQNNSSFPSPAFEKEASLASASRCYSFNVVDDSRETFDIELRSEEQADIFAVVMNSLIPKGVGRQDKSEV
jgi:hypothetical protein